MPVLPFPSEFVPQKEKETVEYGKTFFRAVFEQFGGWTTYSERRARYIDLRRWRSGRQLINTLKDQVGTMEDNSFQNLDWTPPSIIQEKIDRIVNKIASAQYDIICEGIDRTSLSEKDKEWNKLKAQVLLKKRVAALQEETGLPLMDKQRNVPDTMEDAKLYFDLQFRLAEEVAMEVSVDYFFMLNRIEQIKRRVIEDICTLYVGAIRVYRENNNLAISYIDPVNLILPNTQTRDFINAKYIMHIEFMTMGEIRNLAGDELTIEQYRSIANMAAANQQSGSWGNYIGPGIYYAVTRWQNDWNNLSVPVLTGQFRSTDYLGYETNINKFGKKITYKATGEFEETDKRYKVGKEVESIYQGYYIPVVDAMFCYGKKKNMVRNRLNGKYSVQAKLDYCVFMPNNFDNENRSFVDRMIPDARGMHLTALKIQAMVAKASAGGYQINLDAIGEVDINGIDFQANPMKLAALFTQTGFSVYRGLDDQGKPLPPPISVMQGIDLSQLGSLITLYDFYKRNLEQSIGGTGVEAGAAPNPRDPVSVQQQASVAFENALGEIRNAYVDIMQRVCELTVLNAQDLAKQGLFDPYETAIGKRNVDIMKMGADISARDFGIKVEYKDDFEEKQFVNQLIISATANKELDAADGVFLLSTDNTKLKALYLRQAALRKQQQALEMQQANAEVQQQSAIIASQQKIQEEQIKIQGEIALETVRHKNAMELSAQQHKEKMEEIQLQNSGKANVAVLNGGNKQMQSSDMAK